MDERTSAELDAMTFRRLLDHLGKRSDVDNAPLMELAGFCRECLSKWYQEAAEQRGITMSYDEARNRVYGMPYQTWEARRQAGTAR